MTSKACYPQTVLRGHADIVASLAFLPICASSSSSSYTTTGDSDHGNDDLLLSSGAADGCFKIWHLPTRRPIVSQLMHSKHSILSINCNFHQINYLTTSGRDGYSHLWDIDLLSSSVVSKDIQSVRSFNSGCRHFCNTATDGGHILATSSDEEQHILIWDIRCEKHIHTIVTANHGMVSALSVQCNSNRTSSAVNPLYAGFEDGSIASYDIRTYQLLYDKAAVHGNQVMSMDISPNSKQITSVAADQYIHVNSIKHGTNKLNDKLMIEGEKCCDDGINSDAVVLQKHTSIELTNEGCGCIKYRSDGRLVATTHWDNSVKLFDTRKFKLIASLDYHQGSVYALDFAPKNAGSRAGIFATGSKDHNICIWNTAAETLRL